MILDCQNANLSFFNCLKTAVKYYRNEVAEWLIQDFDCKIEADKCASYFNIPAFAYFASINFYNPKEMVMKFPFIKLFDPANFDLNFKRQNTKDEKRIYYFISPIIFAAKCNDLEMVKFFVENGANINDTCVHLLIYSVLNIHYLVLRRSLNSLFICASAEI